MRLKVLIILIVFIMSSFLIYTQQIIGTINIVDGKVEIIRGNKNIKAYPGDDILSSDYILTYDKSSAEIALMDNNGFLRIKENSKISVSSYKGKNNYNFNTILTTGFLTTSFNKKKENSLHVTTSSIVAGVRGTEFNIAASITGESFINVMDGTVAVQDTEVINKNKSVELKEIEFIEIEKGQGALKINQQALDVKKEIRDNLESYRWLINQKLEAQNLKIAINETDIKLSVLKEKIILLNKRINILNGIDKKLKNTYGRLLDKLKDKFKSTSSYDRYKKELIELNAKRLSMIDSSVIFLNQYKVCYDNYDALIENLKSKTIVDNQTMYRYNAKKEKLAEEKNLIVGLENNWNNMIKEYNESEELIEKL
ncbi:MAG: FecR domain-containing protein [Spirochaetes bacterium]|nr:FecR domain-containing protein [Spirochaetota bacterium]